MSILGKSSINDFQIELYAHVFLRHPSWLQSALVAIHTSHGSYPPYVSTEQHNQTVIPQPSSPCQSQQKIPLCADSNLSRLRGLGLKIQELEQGIESISYLISLWESATPASNLLRISLEFLQLEVGTTDLALNKPFSSYSQLTTPGWFTSVQEFLDTHQLEITILSLTTPSPSLSNDITIIESIVSIKAFSAQQIKKINNV